MGGCIGAHIHIQMESIASLSLDVSGSNGAFLMSAYVEASFIDSVDIDCFGKYACLYMDFIMSAARVKSFLITANGKFAIKGLDCTIFITLWFILSILRGSLCDFVAALCVKCLRKIQPDEYG